jgi:hypothetical protein
MGKKAEEMAAYHEAGHVVMSIHRMKRVRYVTIDEKGGRIARHFRNLVPSIQMETIMVRPEKEAWIIETECMIDLAGEIAQKKGVPESFRRSHSEGDMNQLATTAGCPNNKVNAAYMRYLRAYTQDFFNNPVYRCQVETVAKELLKRRYLSEEDIKQLLPYGRTLN